MPPKIDFKKTSIDYEKRISSLALKKARQRDYLTFNFSFMSKNSSYNLSNPKLKPEHLSLLFNRLVELSSKDIVELTSSASKKQGLEKITNFSRKDKISNMKVHDDFVSSVRCDMAGQEFWIFRLCPNNNPSACRIIGKMINDVYYIMFIDLKHELYAKRK